jgi:RND family efflux transporter MFP subunit
MRVILLFPLFVLLLAACQNGSSANEQASQAATVDTVNTFTLTKEAVKKQTTLPGELLPYHRVEIRPKVNGYIRQLKVDIGSVVKKGQVLLVIEAPEIQSRLQEAAVKTQAAKAKYQASSDTYQRLLEASQTDGVIAPNELQRARNQVLADSADYQSAIYAANAYRQVGDYLLITAPVDGIITQRNADIGAYVGNVNDQPVVVLEDNARLRLRVAVPEALTGVQLTADTIRFATKANPDQLFKGKLVRKSGNIDTDNRSEIWEFEVNNQNGQLKSGAFADVKLDITRAGQSFMVPFSAVVTTLEKKFVIRVHDGITEWVDVSQGLNLPDKTEVFGNLQAGDTLVLKANEELKAGTHIAPRQTP